VKALAALGWPICIGILIFVFKNELRALVAGRKLKRGKLFGQEFELRTQPARSDI
jgi:hypothetical protein